MHIFATRLTLLAALALGCGGAIAQEIAAGRAVPADGDTGRGVAGAVKRVFDQHAAVMLLIDPESGRIEHANEAATRFYGRPVERLQEMRIQDINSLSRQQVEDEMALARSESRDHFVFRHRTANGELRTVEVRSSPIDWEGQPRLLSIVTDVSERVSLEGALARQQTLLEQTIEEQTSKIRRDRQLIEGALIGLVLLMVVLASHLWLSSKRAKRAEQDIAEEHRRLENIVDATGIGTWEWQVETGDVRVNDTFLSLLGRHAEGEEIQSMDSLAGIVHAEDLADAQRVLISHLKGLSAHIDHEIRVAHTDGRWIWLRIRGSTVRRNEYGRALVLAGATRDVTATRSSQDHLYHLANYDALTGLPNRVALLQSLGEAMRDSERTGHTLGLAFIDLDDFKPVNDQFGHVIGDKALIRIGKRMLGVMRDSDVLARIGGDEFVALIRGLGDDVSQNQAMFKRLLSAASEPLVIDDHHIHLAASIGTTRYPQDSVLDADQLLRQADQAMYAAKTAGKNRVRNFDLGSLEVAASQREKHDQVIRAIDQNELVLHYQPKVNLRSGQLVGVEALLRWEHQERGLLLPGEFLPFIESPADIVYLGEWVMRTALHQCSLWHGVGFTCPVSVNIDVQQIKRADFTTRLADLLGEFPTLPDGMLELEILETGALEEEVLTRGTLKSCHDMGVKISLDDFGTGFSSLSYLKSVPADCLKIDRSFVMDMLEDPFDLSIIKGVLGLAQAFNRHTVAEGVETIEHGTLLLRLGCEIGQGYVIAQAMPGRKLPSWSESWRPPEEWVKAQRLPRDEHLLLYAQVEMRSWSRRIAAFLTGGDEVPPSISEHMGLASWLQGDAARALRNEPEIFELHQRYEAIQRLLRELDTKPMDRSLLEIYRELGACCKEAQAALDRFIERNALQAVGGHLRVVGG